MRRAFATGSFAQTAPAKPKEPLTISVIDVAGDLQVSQPAIEKFGKDHPELVSRFVFTKATAPELAAKLKAQQDAGRVDIDFVLTGNDALAAGMEQGVWLEILPKYQDRFADLRKLYLPGAYAMQKMGRGQAFVIDWYPSGPLLEYAPDAGQGSARHRRGAAGLVQGASRASSCMRARPIPVRAARS